MARVNKLAAINAAVIRRAETPSMSQMLRMQAERVYEVDATGRTLYLCPDNDADSSEYSIPSDLYYAMEEALGEEYDTEFTVPGERDEARDHRAHAMLLAAEILEN